MPLNANALVTEPEAEAWLKTGGADAAALQEEINRASEWIENYCGRPLKEATYTAIRISGYGAEKLRLKASPVKIDDLVGKPVTIAVNGVAQSLWLQESDGDPALKDVILGSSDLTSPVGRRDYLYRSQGWGPVSAKNPLNVLLTYTGGLATIPDDLKGACLYVLQKFWRDRQKQLADVTTVSGPFGSVSILDISMPRWAQAALDRYRVVAV